MMTGSESCWAGVFVLLLSVCVLAGVPAKGLMHREADGSLQWAAEQWSAAAAPGRGWHSLAVEGDEFLHSIRFRQGQRWITRFPDSSNISHDDALAQHGSVSDGVFLIKLRPDRRNSLRLELYAGHNTTEEAELVVLLSDEVVLARRAGKGPRHAAALVNTTGPKPTALDGVVLVHRSGRALIIEGKCSVDESRTPMARIGWR